MEALLPLLGFTAVPETAEGFIGGVIAATTRADVLLFVTVVQVPLDAVEDGFFYVLKEVNFNFECSKRHIKDKRMKT